MRGFRSGIAVAAALASLMSGAALVAAPAGAAKKDPCVAADTANVEPTLVAPEWYIPGETELCKKTKEDGSITIFTAYWVFYEPCFGCDRWRTTPDNADYSANDCQSSYTTCGNKIIGDATWFYNTCTARGLSASQVATNIRYWADRARANGTDWRVYTFTETGGYPYSCAFSVVQLP